MGPGQTLVLVQTPKPPQVTLHSAQGAQESQEGQGGRSHCPRSTMSPQLPQAHLRPDATPKGPLTLPAGGSCGPVGAGTGSRPRPPPQAAGPVAGRPRAPKCNAS